MPEVPWEVFETLPVLVDPDDGEMCILGHYLCALRILITCVDWAHLGNIRTVNGRTRPAGAKHYPCLHSLGFELAKYLVYRI